MSELHKALGDIDSIRRQMAQCTEFRGYGPATLASTGVIALAAASVQAFWLPDPASRSLAYLGIWCATAVVSASVIGAQMIARTHRIHSGLADEMIHMAIEQFLPAIGTGALLTAVIARFVPSVLWMLPGLWQILSSLGIFSACRFLPRAIACAGAWYLLTGLFSISLAGERALSPWTMGIPYAIGQVLIAVILYWKTPEGAYEG